MRRSEVDSPLGIIPRQVLARSTLGTISMPFELRVVKKGLRRSSLLALLFALRPRVRSPPSHLPYMRVLLSISYVLPRSHSGSLPSSSATSTHKTTITTHPILFELDPPIHPPPANNSAQPPPYAVIATHSVLHIWRTRP